ncbi:MAG: DUF1634 domain-containing protein [Desulfatitalea sp.]|nr:hypothetical protein [Desulfatitalea sp.]NNK00178.1 DUF1634 domain-containing protein [Desulfatitalea sp.]
MAESQNTSLQATPEQLLYAKILEKGMYLGLALLLVTFFIYCFGILKPYISLDSISEYWGMTVSDYLHQADVEAGWAWLGMLNYADFLNFVPIAMLAGLTVICYLAIVPGLFKNGDLVMAVLALLEAVILSIAASGILGSGGH